MARIKRNPDQPPIDELILAAASDLFRRDGFENVSLQKIADAASITPAGIYYHFKNKQDILYRSLERAINALADTCEPSVEMARRDPDRALRSFVENHILYSQRDLRKVSPTYSALVYNMRRRDQLLDAEQGAHLVELELRHLNNLRTILRCGAETGRFRFETLTPTAFAILGMCEHVQVWARPDGPMTDEEIASFFADLILKMIGDPD